MVIPLKVKAIIVVGFTSMVLLLGYDTIVEDGMFGNEEGHVVTVQWKMHEFYWDSGCWNDFFADEMDNVYNTNPDIYAKIQQGHTYYIKTGKRSIFNGRWYAYYIEELPKS